MFSIDRKKLGEYSNFFLLNSLDHSELFHKKLSEELILKKTFCEWLKNILQLIARNWVSIQKTFYKALTIIFRSIVRNWMSIQKCHVNLLPKNLLKENWSQENGRIFNKLQINISRCFSFLFLFCSGHFLFYSLSRKVNISQIIKVESFGLKVVPSKKNPYYPSKKS